MGIPPVGVRPIVVSMDTPIVKSAETCSVAKMRENGSFGQLRAEVMNERFIGEAMETIASNTRVEVALRDW